MGQEEETTVTARMREDWNARAREDAFYYVAFGARGQEDDAFSATAAEVVAGMRREMRRMRPASERSRRALEIGCGPGRLMRPLSQWFGEIHGVDISDEMIARARERLKGITHAHVHTGGGADLKQFADNSFDFVYSYAVFQHIPSRDVVFSYLREADRVLKPGGIARFQVNGLAKSAREYDTWSGVRIDPQEILSFCASVGWTLHALEGTGTQYTWVTVRKAAVPVGNLGEVRIRRITNANSSEPVAPASGRYASISVWVEGLPNEAGLLDLQLFLRDKPCILTYLGPPEAGGLTQLNALLGEGIPTGLQPVRLGLQDKAISPVSSFFRIVPAPPLVPRIVEWSDGIDLSAGRQIRTGTVKLYVEELRYPDQVEVYLDGRLVEKGLDIFCTDPRSPRYEVNVELPDWVTPREWQIQLRDGARRLAPVRVRVG